METGDWVSWQLPAAVLLQCLCLKHVIMPKGGANLLKQALSSTNNSHHSNIKELSHHASVCVGVYVCVCVCSAGSLSSATDCIFEKREKLTSLKLTALLHNESFSIIVWICNCITRTSHYKGAEKHLRSCAEEFVWGVLPHGTGWRQRAALRSRWAGCRSESCSPTLGCYCCWGTSLRGTHTCVTSFTSVTFSTLHTQSQGQIY